MNTFLYRIFYWALGVAFIIFPFYVYGASVFFNEIMYDLKTGSDTGREWIELYNNGSTSIDITEYKLFEANTSHTIKLFQGNASIPSGGYALLADNPEKFLADHAGFSGSVFDTTFSLSNEGETISIRDKSNTDIDSLTFSPSMGAKGNGASLSKIDGIFVEGNETPGALNIAFSGDSGADSSIRQSSSTSETVKENTTDYDVSTSSNTTDVNTNNANSNSASVSTGSFASGALSTHSYPGGLVSMKENPLIKVDAGRERLVTVHAPILFSARALDSKGGEINRMDYRWSFGDGLMAYGSAVEHTYLFPGDYNVVLFAQKEDKNVRLTARTKVHVKEPVLSITDAFISEKGFVSIKNFSNQEVNIGEWKIIVGDSVYTFLPDTIMMPNSALRFPYMYRGSIVPDHVLLTYPDGTVATTTKKFNFDRVGFFEKKIEALRFEASLLNVSTKK